MTSPTERFNILNQFLGFGNPRGILWFVGLEEAGCWHSDPQQDEASYQRYALGSFSVAPGEIQKESEKYGRSYTRVYDIMSKLAIGVLLPQESGHAGWREYRDNRLLVQDGETFQINLYPLGKKSLTAWPQYY